MASKQGIGFKPQYMNEVNELINTSFEPVRNAQEQGEEQAFAIHPKSKALLMLLQKIDTALSEKVNCYPLVSPSELVHDRIDTMLEHIFIKYYAELPY